MRHSIKDIFSSRPAKSFDEDLYKTRKIPYKKDDLRILESLLKSAAKPSRAGQGGFSGGGRHTRFAPSENGKRQRVMFKMSHSENLKVHQNYLQTYMPQENKSFVEEKPVLFGTDEAEYKKNMSPLHFKCIISPENQNVNLEVLSNEFIKRVEALTGYKLFWRGCIHSDTEHRHAHLCINGKDKNGKKVYFQKELIRRMMRETLSYVATELVGERSEREIEAARKSMFSARRWTKLDEELERYSGKISARNLDSEIQSRISFLVEIGLAKKKSNFYELDKNWKNVLLAAGRYNTFLEEYQKSGGKLELYAGGKLEGTCARVITFDKDEAWNDALVVDTGKRLVYVPVWQLSKDGLQGKKIEVSGGTESLSRQIRSSDIRIKERKRTSGIER